MFGNRVRAAASRLDSKELEPITGNEMVPFYQSTEQYVIKTQLAPDNHQ